MWRRSPGRLAVEDKPVLGAMWGTKDGNLHSVGKRRLGLKVALLLGPKREKRGVYTKFVDVGGSDGLVPTNEGMS